MLLQLVSACTALAALAQLAGAAGVQRRTTFHVAAACQLVFDLGHRTITVLVAQADQAAALRQPPDQRAPEASAVSDSSRQAAGCLAQPELSACGGSTV